MVKQIRPITLIDQTRNYLKKIKRMKQEMLLPQEENKKLIRKLDCTKGHSWTYQLGKNKSIRIMSIYRSIS